MKYSPKQRKRKKKKLTPPPSLPDNTFEINAWIYGLNWCSSANLISRNNNDICDLPPTGPNTAFEFMHAPMFNKFGRPVEGCYANMDVLFQGCDITMGGSVTDYGAVVAQFTSKDKMSQYTYQCVQDVEYHGCVYNSQVQPFSEIKYEAFMSVSFGISFFWRDFFFC